MQVTLRIVGLYFRKTVTIQDIPGKVVTIKDVIEAYIQQVGDSSKPEGLDYSFEPIQNVVPNYKEEAAPPRGESLLGFAYHNSVPQPTLSGVLREIGIYSLFENYQAHPKVGLAWQSYVLDTNKQNRTATKIAEGFRYFNQTEVFDGETIVWRLVAICRAPNYPPVTELT